MPPLPSTRMVHIFITVIGDLFLRPLQQKHARPIQFEQRACSNNKDNLELLQPLVIGCSKLPTLILWPHLCALCDIVKKAFAFKCISNTKSQLQGIQQQCPRLGAIAVSICQWQVPRGECKSGLGADGSECTVQHDHFCNKQQQQRGHFMVAWTCKTFEMKMGQSISGTLQEHA